MSSCEAMIPCDRFCSFLDEAPVSPPSSPLGGGRKKQRSELPIGPDPEVPVSSEPEEKFASTVNPARKSVLGEERRRIWVHGPRPEYKKNSQRFNLPSRILPLVRPNIDLVILPGQHQPTQEFWDFCRDILGLAEWQALFTSGDLYNMDDDVDDGMIEKMRELITNSGCGWTLVPYCVTSNFKRWTAKLSDLDVETFGEELEWVDLYGHKGALHRHVRRLDAPSLVEIIDPTIVVAKGYTCSNVEDLLEAYSMIGSKRVVVKPVFGAAGEGIIFMSSTEELKNYDFPMGEVCLEEHLDLDMAPDGIVLSPAMHYNEGEFVGDDLVDQIMKGTSYMGWRRSVVSPAFQETARQTLRKFMDFTDPKGPGGVDFLSVGGRPFLSDLNTGRFNGCHGPKLFRIQFAPNTELFVWKGRAPATLTAKAFWAKCVEAGCAFVPGVSQEGVFPLLYLRGRSFMIVALGRDEEACQQLYRTAGAFLVDPPVAAAEGDSAPRPQSTGGGPEAPAAAETTAAAPSVAPPGAGFEPV